MPLRSPIRNSGELFADSYSRNPATYAGELLGSIPENELPSLTEMEAAQVAPDADVERGIRSTLLGMEAGGLFADSQDREAARDMEGAARLDEQARRVQVQAGEMQARVPSFGDVHNAGDFVDYAQQGIGSVLTTAAPAFAAGIPGAIAGGMVGGPVGAFLGGTAAGAAVMYPMEAGDMASQQQNDPFTREHVSVEDRIRSRDAYAGVASLFEAIVPGGMVAGRTIARPLVRAVAKNAMQTTGKKAFGRTLAAVGESQGEGFTELSQQLAQEHFLDQDNPNRDRSGDRMARIDSYILGMFGGASMSGAASLPGYAVEKLSGRTPKSATGGIVSDAELQQPNVSEQDIMEGSTGEVADSQLYSRQGTLFDEQEMMRNATRDSLLYSMAENTEFRTDDEIRRAAKFVLENYPGIVETEEETRLKGMIAGKGLKRSKPTDIDTAWLERWAQLEKEAPSYVGAFDQTGEVSAGEEGQIDLDAAPLARFMGEEFEDLRGQSNTGPTQDYTQLNPVATGYFKGHQVAVDARDAPAEIMRLLKEGRITHEQIANKQHKIQPLGDYLASQNLSPEELDTAMLRMRRGLIQGIKANRETAATKTEDRSADIVKQIQNLKSLTDKSKSERSRLNQYVMITLQTGDDVMATRIQNKEARKLLDTKTPKTAAEKEAQTVRFVRNDNNKTDLKTQADLARIAWEANPDAELSWEQAVETGTGMILAQGQHRGVLDPLTKKAIGSFTQIRETEKGPGAASGDLIEGLSRKEHFQAQRRAMRFEDKKKSQKLRKKESLIENESEYAAGEFKEETAHTEKLPFTGAEGVAGQTTVLTEAGKAAEQPISEEDKALATLRKAESKGKNTFFQEQKSARVFEDQTGTGSREAIRNKKEDIQVTAKQHLRAVERIIKDLELLESRTTMTLEQVKTAMTKSAPAAKLYNNVVAEALDVYEARLREEEATQQRRVAAAEKVKRTTKKKKKAVKKASPKPTVVQHFTRASVENDSKSLYLFTDNATRTSGATPIPSDTWYAEKYGVNKNYPGTTQAVIRGLKNAFPITTMVNGMRRQWTEAQFEQFKAIIDNEIATIKKALPRFPGGIKLGPGRIGQGSIAQLPAKLQEYLDSKLAEIGIKQAAPVRENSGTQPQPTAQNSRTRAQKTASGNVIVKNGVAAAKAYVAADTANRVYTLRTSGAYHFGNPFSSERKYPGVVQMVKTTAEAVQAYRDWLTTTKYDNDPAFGPREKARKQWILQQLPKLKGKELVYYKELGEPSHANALDELIQAAPATQVAPGETASQPQQSPQTGFKPRPGFETRVYNDIQKGVTTFVLSKANSETVQDMLRDQGFTRTGFNPTTRLHTWKKERDTKPQRMSPRIQELLNNNEVALPADPKERIAIVRKAMRQLFPEEHLERVFFRMSDGVIYNEFGKAIDQWGAFYTQSEDKITINLYATDSMAEMLWNAWHESYHRGANFRFQVNSEKNVLDKTKTGTFRFTKEFTDILTKAYRNPFVRDITLKMLDRGYDGSFNVIEEALVEIGAALETKNYEKFKADFGVDIPVDMRSKLAGVVNEFVQAVRKMLGLKTTTSNQEVLDILKEFRKGLDEPKQVPVIFHYNDDAVNIKYSRKGVTEDTSTAVRIALETAGFKFVYGKNIPSMDALHRVASKTLRMENPEDSAAALAVLVYNELKLPARNVQMRENIQAAITTWLQTGQTPTNIEKTLWAQVLEIVNRVMTFLTGKEYRVIEQRLTDEFQKIVQDPYKFQFKPALGRTKTDFQTLVNKNPLVDKLFQSLAKTKVEYSLTGSMAYADQTSIYRNMKLPIHDVDLLYSSQKDIDKSIAQVEKDFGKGMQLYDFKPKDVHTHRVVGYVYPSNPKHTIEPITLKKFKRTAKGWLPERSWRVLDENGKQIGKYQLKVNRRGESKDIVEGDIGIAVDFMHKAEAQNAVPQSYTSAVTGKQEKIQVSHFIDGFVAKLTFLRDKDITDLLGATPAEEATVTKLPTAMTPKQRAAAQHADILSDPVLQNDELSAQGFKSLIPDSLTDAWEAWSSEYMEESDHAFENLNQKEREFLEEVADSVNGYEKQEQLLAKKAIGKNKLTPVQYSRQDPDGKNTMLKAWDKTLTKQGKVLRFNEQTGKYEVVDQQGELDLSATKELRKSLSGMRQDSGFTSAEEAILNNPVIAKRAKAVRDYILRAFGPEMAAQMKLILGRDAVDSNGQFYSGAYNIADRVIKVAIDSLDPLSVTFHESMHDFAAQLEKTAEGKNLHNRLKKMASTPFMIKQLKTLLANEPAALAQLSDVNERVAYIFQFYAASQQVGGPVFKIHNWKNLIQLLIRAFSRITGVITHSQASEKIFNALYSGDLAGNDFSSLAEYKSKTLKEAIDYTFNTLKGSLGGLMSTPITRMKAMNIPAISELARMWYSDPLDKGELGTLQRTQQQQGIFRNEYRQILTDLKPTEQELKTAGNNLQAMRLPTTPLEKRLAAFFNKMYAYTQYGDNPVLRFDGLDPQSNQPIWSAMEKAKYRRYFPRNWDIKAILAKRKLFTSLLMEHGGLEEEDVATFIENLEKSDGAVEQSYNPEFSPFMGSVNKRVFEFISPKNAEFFVEFQEQNITKIIDRYIRDVTHRREHSRTFGSKGEVTTRLLKEARAQGATTAQLDYVKKAIQGLEGRLGTDKVSDLMRNVMVIAMSIVNFAVLPLALFSSLVDPLGVLIRTGSVKSAAATFAAGVRQIVNDARKTKSGSMQELAEFLGIIENNMAMDIMNNTENGMFMNEKLRKLNAFFFKAIGLEQWTRGTRIGALQAGIGYLRANYQNQKALDELGLKAGDIELTADGIKIHQLEFTTGDTAGNEAKSRRVQNALYRMVDESILRPSAGTRPLWMSDQRFLLMGHLKQFTFTFHNTIVKQLNTRMKEAHADGESWAKASLAFAPLLTYVPAMMAADMVRSMVAGRWDEDDDEKSFMETFFQALQRSAILGNSTFIMDIGDDIQFGGLPINTVLGPVAEKGFSLSKGILDPDVSFTKAAMQLMPGYAAWAHWGSEN